MGTLGVQEMIVIFLLALVLFGPKKLPELGRTLGKALTEFRRASSDLKATFEREMQNLERENQSLKDATQATVNEIYDHATSFSYAYEDQGRYAEETQAALPAPTTPATVGASEVPGAESHGNAATPNGETHETASVAVAPQAPVEGAIPRNGSDASQQHS